MYFGGIHLEAWLRRATHTATAIYWKEGTRAPSDNNLPSATASCIRYAIKTDMQLLRMGLPSQLRLVIQV